MSSNAAALTTNSELLDDLVLAASRGDGLALAALAARHSGVVIRLVRARVAAHRRCIISDEAAWASARLAIRRIGALQASGTPFLAWLELSAKEAFEAPIDARDGEPDRDDGIADVDRCALDLHVLGYGSNEIASVLAEPQAVVCERIEATKRRLWAQALAANTG